MGKRHVSVRLEESTIEAVDAWAEAHGMTRTAALESIVMAGLGGASGTPVDAVDATEARDGTEVPAGDMRAVCDVLRASNADLRAEVSRLWSQLGEKDRQIASAHELADHAQALQAAQAQTKLLGAADVAQGGTRGTGWRGRLARWIAGGKE